MAYNKYYLQKKQVSYDNGLTWEDVTPSETRQGAYIDSYQTLAECETIDYSTQYLTIESKTNNNTIYWYTGNSAITKTISASTDNGQTWVSYTSITGNGTTIATLNAGDKVLIKGTNGKYSNNRFSSSGQFNAYGNIMSLVSGDTFENAGTLTGTYTFTSLFSGCTGLISAENLVLPATTLATSCYQSMFEDCTNLTTAPELPATTLAERCYYYMFSNCTSLTTAPELPATTLASYCYHYMFEDCTSLTTAPELPATMLENGCYNGMFQSCANLTTAPELPATTLKERCYVRMFGDCTSLTTAPELPATTLAIWCCQSMFYGCSSLTTAPELPATDLAEYCYGGMFGYCTSLTTAPELPATTLVNNCYNGMFQGCRSLNYIKCLATDISATDCTKYWLDIVAATGTFVKAASMNDWTTGYHGIPSGWTVQNNS